MSADMPLAPSTRPRLHTGRAVPAGCACVRWRAGWRRFDGLGASTATLPRYFVERYLVLDATFPCCLCWWVDTPVSWAFACTCIHGTHHARTTGRHRPFPRGDAGSWARSARASGRQLSGVAVS